MISCHHVQIHHDVYAREEHKWDYDTLTGGPRIRARSDSPRPFTSRKVRDCAAISLSMGPHLARFAALHHCTI